ncbi:MAG: DUF3365 domain-containing protein [Desmonostoc vinosum HA7617-LM4]|jgi:HAMP domain-containing protein|nr:DUF3365 domain-containing protein [Desmonostoc vinosum HA7617-LM4]
MLNNLKIGTKFNILLIIVFIISIIVSGATLSNVIQGRAQYEVASQALVLMQMVNSVRYYTQNRIVPLLTPKLDTETAFIPEVVPSFSATEVFENFRQTPEYKNFLHKDAVLNPTNLRDKADSFEIGLIERFRKDSNNKQLSGFRSLPEAQLFYIAKPIVITQQQCLRCHSTPDQAPKSQLVAYGSDNGFGWKLNEVLGVQVVSVPSQEIFANAKRRWLLVMVLLVAIFAIIIILINFLINKFVIQRIRKIEKVAQNVSTGDVDADFEENSNDEIGGLAKAFNRMKSSLKIAMDMLNNS